MPVFVSGKHVCLSICLSVTFEGLPVCLSVVRVPPQRAAGESVCPLLLKACFHVCQLCMFDLDAPLVNLAEAAALERRPPWTSERPPSGLGAYPSATGTDANTRRFDKKLDYKCACT
jgi:hypothetical protein